MRIKNIMLLLLGLALLSAGCSKKSDNPSGPDNNPGNALTNSGTMVINGAGYSNTNITLTAGMSGFVSSNNATSCVLYGKGSNDSLAVVITFPGKSTGDFNWQGLQNSSSNTYYDGCTLTFYGSKVSVFVVDNGKTSVTAFGDVGNTIEGDFSGTLKSMDGTQSISVNGSFKCLRVQDE